MCWIVRWYDNEARLSRSFRSFQAVAVDRPTTDIFVLSFLFIRIARADRLALWWDRETDGETGRLLREDVRRAAHRVWRWVCVKSRQILGDSSDAAEVMEAAVAAICRYLDKKNVAINSTDPSGLLAVAAYRLLRRAARKRHRVEFVGSTTELAEKLRAPNWRYETDGRLLVQELAREMDERARGMLRLRMAGYSWDEIARMLHMTATAVRSSFWRDIRKVHLRLLTSGKATQSEEW